MSVLTLYCANPIQSGSSAGLLTPTQPGASTSTTGWTIAKNAAGRYSRMTYNAEVNSGNIVTTAQNSGAPIQTAAKLACDCWRTSAATTGDFSAGTWYSSLSLIAVTAATNGAVNINVRIWRSANADGSSPTEITKSNMTGSTVTNILTTAAQSSSASTQVGAFSLANEYLFMQAAVQIRTASGNNSSDAMVRLGSLAQTNGSGLITADFTPTGGGGGAVIGAGYYNEYYQHLVSGVL